MNHQDPHVHDTSITLSRQSAWLIGVSAVLLYAIRFFSLQGEADTWSQVQSVSFYLQNHSGTVNIKVSDLPAQYYTELLDAFGNDNYYVTSTSGNSNGDKDSLKNPDTECSITIAEGYMKKVDTQLFCTNISTHRSSALISIAGNPQEYVDKIFLGIHDSYAEIQNDPVVEHKM